MEDPVVQRLPEICGAGGAGSLYFGGGAESTSGDGTPAAEPRETVASEEVEDTITSMDEGNVSSGSKEFSSSKEPALPILQKITNLSSKIQNLKNDHAILTDEVKKITADLFVQPEVSSALQLLGKENEHLKKKFVQESTERKRLYNEVIELKGNIRVFCRCRPINQAELEKGSNSVVEFDSLQENELQILSSDSSKKQFKFDHVFKPEDNQEAVFAETKPIVTSVLDGYNVCIFAYGQTGTGKTFTMEGTSENRGVNYRTLEELFLISEERKGYMKYELFVSMLEVYNEKLRDLLVENSKEPSKRLDIKQAADGTQEVPGLVESHVSNTEEVWKLLQSGNCIRSVGSTSANEQSSRSHCLLRVTVKGENLIDGQKTRSHLWLVDLAGSERVGKIEVEGERLKESQFINKSLSALGDVISALASKTSHVPYRNSKLTHMLQSSLGGDCKTLMFVQISPSSSDLGETLCSLNFATRVRGIETGPARKHADVNELYKYKQMADKMKHDEKETKKLQDTVQSLQLRLTAKDSMFRTLQEKVKDLENQLEEERKTRIKQENRAFAAAASVRSSLFASMKQQTSTENNSSAANNNNKPPLAPPSKLRMPLRRITNFMPQQQPSPVKRPSAAWKRKENNNSNVIPRGNGNNNNNNNSRNLVKPRRSSVAVRPPPPTMAATQNAGQVRQPKRRVSVATYIPEPSLISTPHVGSQQRQAIRGGARRGRYSSLFSPLPESEIVGTPAAARFTSSKFMGSPPVVPGSWKPKHPTVVALQRKSLVWSPLRGMMKNGGGGGGRSRPSFIAAINQRN